MIKAIYNNIMKQRQEWLDWEKNRDEKFVFPESVEYITNAPIGYGDFAAADIYRPNNVNDKLPVIINIHGGGFVMGTRHQNHEMCACFAGKGFLVIAIDYPLVPESDVFGQLDVISKSLNMIKDKLDELKGDEANVSLVGDSAGAFLALYTVAIQKSEKLQAAAKVTKCTLSIRSLGLSSGLYYSTRVESNGIFLLRNSFFGKGWRKHAFYKYLNPENEEVIKALPRCILSTSDSDFLRKHTLQFANALKKHGIENQLVFIEADKSAEHAFNALYPTLSSSITVNDSMVSFFKSQKIE